MMFSFLLTLSQTTNFRLFQVQRVCRRQFQKKVLQVVRKHWEKEKLLITSNFSFSHRVFKGLVLQTRKNQGLFGKGLNDRVDLENIVGKGKNAGYQYILLKTQSFLVLAYPRFKTVNHHFLLFPQWFHLFLPHGCFKLCGKELNKHTEGKEAILSNRRKRVRIKMKMMLKAHSI